MRMANLLASVDGNVSIADNASLQAMQRQFDELQGKAPEHLANEVDTNNARDALKWLPNRRTNSLEADPENNPLDIVAIIVAMAIGALVAFRTDRRDQAPGLVVAKS